MNIFVLTGPGISAESGLDGSCNRAGTDVCTRSAPAKVAARQAFDAHPEEVYAYYNGCRRNLLAAKPNAAHEALAALESGLRRRDGDLFLCTHNIDDLHERAGSRRVVHVHGELLKARCLVCAQTLQWRGDLTIDDHCPSCGPTGRLRPDVVWFDEPPLHVGTILDALARADLLVTIGTPGSSYPAAPLVAEARQLGVRTCELNLEPSGNLRQFDERRYGPLSKVVPAWVQTALSGQGDQPRPTMVWTHAELGPD